MASRNQEAKAGMDRGKASRRKDLRHNAREAQEHFSYIPAAPPVRVRSAVGRGQSGESSN